MRAWERASGERLESLVPKADEQHAIRRAGDELAASDQSPASRLVRQAADGLENFSRSLSDKQPEDLLNSVRDFGRRNPMAFIGGAVLVAASGPAPVADGEVVVEGGADAFGVTAPP